MICCRLESPLCRAHAVTRFSESVARDSVLDGCILLLLLHLLSLAPWSKPPRLPARSKRGSTGYGIICMAATTRVRRLDPSNLVLS